MLDDRSRAARFLLTGIVALALVIGGVVIGATLWPRIVTVEQRVIAPAVRAVARDREISAIPDLIDAECPAVVAIEPQASPTDPNRHFAHIGKAAKANLANLPPARLSGFLVSADGDVLTSTRYLPDDGGLTVLLNDGRRLDATRAGADPVSGLALLKVQATELPFLQLATDNFPRVGQWGLALTSPHGSGCVVQFALVSADFVAEQAYARAYVRVTPLLPAALAGAPVLDADGRVMGVAGLGPELLQDGTRAKTEDASLLVPATTAASVMSELLRNSLPTTNPLGLYADDLTPVLAARLGTTRQLGAVVTMVRANSPAARAGVKAGDVILSVSDSPIGGASELGRALDGAGEQIPLGIARGVEHLNIVLQNRSEQPE